MWMENSIIFSFYKLFMYSKSDHIEIMIGIHMKLLNNLLAQFLLDSKRGLETSMWYNDFVFDSIDRTCYKYRNISLNRRGWYINSPDWINSKRKKINSKNKDDKCFQYAVTVALQPWKY